MKRMHLFARRAVPSEQTVVTQRSEALQQAWTIAVASAVIIAAMIIASVSAGAVNQRVRTACKNDYFRHCPAYEVGTAKLRTCMTKAGKRKQLSHRCLRALIDAGQVPRRYLKSKYLKRL